MSRDVFGKLWRGYDPYAGFEARRFRSDIQGWNSHHEFLSDTITQNRPSLVVELGVWKGGSTMYIAETLRSNRIDGCVVAVDTWLGSWEHWEQDEHFHSLLFQNGYPSMFYTFLTNVVERNLKEYVVPLPLDSANAAFVLSRRSIVPQVVHIDGGHDYEAVLSDLQRWWALLEPGGTLIADDYDVEGIVWPSVRDAVNDFLKSTAHIKFEAVPFKCRFTKPRE